jgi:3-oxoacyl-[acyl-carrier protein] reductase
VTSSGVALVTGAGTGIGRAVALALAVRGHDVVVTGRRRALLDETVRLIESNGGLARPEVLDVTDPTAVGRLSELAKGKRVDVVVVNAGTFVRGGITDLDIGDWSTQIDVNLNGAYYCIREAVRVMRDQQLVGASRGHIFSVNSGAAVRGFPSGVGYAAAKHGLRGLIESVRLQVASLGIKVTDIIVSATIESEMSAGRNVTKLPASVVAHTIVSCLDLEGAANWDRVDLSQLDGG